MPRRVSRKQLESQPPRVQTYGFAPGLDQWRYDLAAFAWRKTVDDGAPPRPMLFRRIAEVLTPGRFEWHEWTNRMISALSAIKREKDGTLAKCSWVGLAGCSNSAKTFNVVNFACTWWAVAPAASSVTFVSTTLKSLRKRAWAEVSAYHYALGENAFGNFTDSKVMWQAVQGDDKHSIVGRAVEEGSVQKVADDIKGIHTVRQMVVIDEATAVPEAIFDAATNLFSYPDEFVLIVIGNPRSRLDQMGKFCEPKDGWTSVSVDTEEWETRPQLDGNTGTVVRFDAEKSPNIVECKDVSRHLPTREKVAAVKKEHGDSPWYWSNFRGFWPPEGLLKTVFTESGLAAADAYGTLRFTGDRFTVIGAFDPAFGGGDRAALRFARMGMVEGDKWGIQVGPPIIVAISAHSTVPVHFQLAEGVKRHCEKVEFGEETYSCPPSNLCLDASGEGGGLADIMQRQWSPAVVRIEFNGRPSEQAVSHEDARLACDVYENKATEMWFRARDAVNHGQMKGIDRATAKELCAREFDDTGRRIGLQRKADYKAKFGESCDFSDSLVMLCEMARLRGFRMAPMGQTATLVEEVHKVAAKAQEVYHDISYSEDEQFDYAIQ